MPGNVRSVLEMPHHFHSHFHSRFRARWPFPEWTQHGREFPKESSVGHWIEEQAARNPRGIAVVHGEEQIDFGDLNRRADRVAGRLRALGVRADDVVGVCWDHSIGWLAALLGVWKAVGAFLPVDANSFDGPWREALEDANVKVILAETKYRDRLSVAQVEIVSQSDLERGNEAEADLSENHVREHVPLEGLAAVIFAKDCGGPAQGLMITHRQVAHYFAALDRLLGKEPGVWLTVPNLPWHFSVFELFWALARGFKIVLGPEHRERGASRPTPGSARGKGMEFSLFYFACDDAARTGDKYRLLVEGAKFADENGFTAVWTPERHFHRFGGLYPNPSVTSAALAMITKRLQLRAGSVVLPLHNPIRVAEEWSVVDNLSQGRVAIAFAPGWHANDFVIAPERFPDRRQALARQIELVRKLWRGESIRSVNGAGAEINVKIFPRPVQPELPIWVTASGSAETFRFAGEVGANVLTHLLGQTIGELAAKIAQYRKAWRERDHQTGSGHVTLMLHTFVADDFAALQGRVRKPFREYLQTSTDLFRNARTPNPGSGDTCDRAAASAESVGQDNDAVMEYAFQRYFRENGMFGTPEVCAAMVKRLQAIGVDEIACLIDFGVEDELVLRHLSSLAEVRKWDQRNGDSETNDQVWSAFIRRHHVTHVQCSASLAQELTSASEGFGALKSVRRLFINDGVLAPGVMRRRDEGFKGKIHHLCGAAEKFVCGSHLNMEPDHDFVAIESSVLEAQRFVLNDRLEPVSAGVVGHLFIGVENGPRGYLNRPERTAERFLPHPYSLSPGARLFRTNQRARYRADGDIELLSDRDEPEPLQDRGAESPASRPPSWTPTEARLVDIWRSLFGRNDVTPKHSFFELGGQSLLATELIMRVRETFQVELPMSRLFTSPTIAALAGLIDAS